MLVLVVMLVILALLAIRETQEIMVLPAQAELLATLGLLVTLAE